MKKIVILSAFLSPLRSGAEACAEEVPLALCDQFDFTIITARMRRDLPKNDQLQGKIPIIRVGIGGAIDKWLFPFLAPIAVANIKPDIVHAILETFAGLALVFCKTPKKILTCQTTNRSFLKGFVVRSANQVTAISTALVDIVRCYRSDQIIHIPNGIHLSLLTHARETIAKVPGRILFVGRLEPQKGVDTLLATLAKVESACLPARQGKCLPAGEAGKVEKESHLRIIGDGSQRQSLERIAADLGIMDRVTFTGRVSPDCIAKEYAEAEIFCGLSRSEALGNVFLEAQAAGCAVVGTSVGGIPDIIEHNKTGLLVPPDDVDAACSAIKCLIKDADLRHRIAKAGIAHAAQYDWSGIAQKYAELY